LQYTPSRVTSSTPTGRTRRRALAAHCSTDPIIQSSSPPTTTRASHRCALFKGPQRELIFVPLHLVQDYNKGYFYNKKHAFPAVSYSAQALESQFSNQNTHKNLSFLFTSTVAQGLCSGLMTFRYWYLVLIFCGTTKTSVSTFAPCGSFLYIIPISFSLKIFFFSYLFSTFLCFLLQSEV
jgi:hypothetical protein